MLTHDDGHSAQQMTAKYRQGPKQGEDKRYAGKKHGSALDLAEGEPHTYEYQQASKRDSAAESDELFPQREVGFHASKEHAAQH